MKVCINSRDELVIIDLEKVACFSADGNYTNVNYIQGQKVTISMGLSKVEGLIGSFYPKGKASPFTRLGRSLLINQTYLCQIDILKQKIVLSDNNKASLTISVTKNMLKTYKAFVQNSFKPVTK